MNDKTAEDLALDAEAKEVDAFLARAHTTPDWVPECGCEWHDKYYDCKARRMNWPEERPRGGWVHRAALGTLPTFCTLSTAYAYEGRKEQS